MLVFFPSRVCFYSIRDILLFAAAASGSVQTHAHAFTSGCDACACAWGPFGLFNFPILEQSS